MNRANFRHGMRGHDHAAPIGAEFLEQPDLTQFHFQRHFMAPFLQIFETQKLLETREYLLENITGLMRDTAPVI
jgi:hypothetical protein